MKIASVILMMNLFLFVQVRAPGQIHNRARLDVKQNGEDWHPGSFRGLTVGKSRRAAMLHTLGKPKRKDSPEGQSGKHREVWYVYDNVGEFPGEFTVIVERRTDRILKMILYPDNLSKANAIQHFGKKYRFTKYEFCPGFDEAESAPVFESEHGNALYIEYRSRGLALFVGDSEVINDIRYVGQSIGFVSKGECLRALQKYRASLHKIGR